MTASKPELHIVLCSPRGFCAGVVRAIDTVERALKLERLPLEILMTVTVPAAAFAVNA